MPRLGYVMQNNIFAWIGNIRTRTYRPPPSSTPTPDASPSPGNKGFINFYGVQRFGRDGTNSVDVGLLLLKSDWGAAVQRILAPHPADTAEVSAAKEAYFATGARAALRCVFHYLARVRALVG